MRTFSIGLILVIAGSVAACSKLYFDDSPTNGKLNGPDAGTYPPGDAGLTDSFPPDADNDGGCGGGGGTDGGPNYPDAGPCCNYPPDAAVAYPDAY